MYEAYFNLREKPFSLNPDPEYLYPSRRHRAALTMLEYGLAGRAGFVVLTGEVGSGKTTLIRHFLRQAREEATIGVITNTHQSLGDLMQWIALAFGLETARKEKVELYADFMQFVESKYRNGGRVILVVDEAQNMSIETLEELRMLSNVNVEKDMMLQTILVGQPELLEVLRLPELAQFAQRVAIDYHLTRLSYSETRAYIRHRLQVAGGSRNLFNTEAIGGIYYFSNGIPRVINILCDSALVYAFADEKNQVDVGTVLSVAADRRTGLMKSVGEQYKDIDRMSLQSALQRFASYEKETEDDPAERPARDDQPHGEHSEALDSSEGSGSIFGRIEPASVAVRPADDGGARSQAAKADDYRGQSGSPGDRGANRFDNINQGIVTDAANGIGQAPPRRYPPVREPSVSSQSPPKEPVVPRVVKPLFGKQPIIPGPRIEPPKGRRLRRWLRLRP